MAAKQGTDFISIMGELKARRFRPIYLLMGEESYYIDQICDYLAENVLKAEEVDFNRTICYGNDTTASQVVDTATDAAIRQGLRSTLPGTTKVIIAQRISSVQDADIIVVLDDGKISGVGSHAELLKTNEIYREVYESQQGGGAIDG